MLDWLMNNWSTLLVGLVLLAVVVLIIRKMIKDKKSGKSIGCGCGCKDCALSGACGGNKEKTE